MSDTYRRAFERHYCVTEGTPLKEIEAGRRGDRYRSAHIDRAWESWQKEIGHLHPAPAQPQVPDWYISRLLWTIDEHIEAMINYKVSGEHDYYKGVADKRMSEIKAMLTASQEQESP